MKLIKYRISSDVYAGYEVQCWRFMVSFLITACHGQITNTHTTIEDAEKYAKGGNVIKYID